MLRMWCILLHARTNKHTDAHTQIQKNARIYLQWDTSELATSSNILTPETKNNIRMKKINQKIAWFTEITKLQS